MLCHGLEIYSNLEYDKLLRIYECGKAIRQISERVFEDDSRYKRKEIGFFAFRKIIKEAVKELNYFQAEIVSVLTNAKDPIKYVKYLSDFIEQAGLKKEATEGDVEDPYQAVVNIATHVAVHLGKTPKEIIKNLTPNDTPVIIAEITKKGIADQMAMVNATHADPVKYFRDLQSQYRLADSKKHAALNKYDADSLIEAKEHFKDEKVVEFASFKDMIKRALEP